MIAFLVEVLATGLGVTLALLVVGSIAVPVIVRWLDRWLDDELWPASRSCDNVDGAGRC